MLNVAGYCSRLVVLLLCSNNLTNLNIVHVKNLTAQFFAGWFIQKKILLIFTSV